MSRQEISELTLHDLDDVPGESSRSARSRNHYSYIVFAWAVALLITLGAPLALIAIGQSKTQSAGSEAPQGDRWVPAAKPASWPKYNAEAKVTLADEPAALKIGVGMTGTVTELPAVIPERLVSGTYVISIDGVALTAYSGETPFYRPLNLGMKGSDVLEFNRLLGTFGYISDGSNYWGPATESGAKKYLRDIGVQQEGAVVFQPSYVVWVPKEGVTIAGYKVDLGQVLTAPAADIFLPKRSIRSIALDQQSELLRTVKAGWKIKYNDASYDYSGDPNNIFTAKDQSLIHLAPNAEKIRVEFYQNFGSNVISVPPSSILDDVKGQHCIIARSAAGKKDILVNIMGGEIGRTFIEASGNVEINEILINPHRANEQLCKSA